MMLVCCGVLGFGQSTCQSLGTLLQRYQENLQRNPATALWLDDYVA